MKPENDAPLWGRWERAFTAEPQARPETALVVELLAPSGQERSIAGFWDGGSTWRVRAMPDEEGEWRYRTRSLPAVAGLEGETGSFDCRRDAAPNRFLQHGAV